MQAVGADGLLWWSPQLVISHQQTDRKNLSQNLLTVKFENVFTLRNYISVRKRRDAEYRTHLQRGHAVPYF